MSSSECPCEYTLADSMNETASVIIKILGCYCKVWGATVMSVHRRMHPSKHEHSQTRRKRLHTSNLGIHEKYVESREDSTINKIMIVNKDFAACTRMLILADASGTWVTSCLFDVPCGRVTTSEHPTTCRLAICSVRIELIRCLIHF